MPARSAAIRESLWPRSRPHFPAKAKSVIWCFLDGGPSHIDLFDPKPDLTKLARQAAAGVASSGRSRRWAARPTRRCWPRNASFKQHGQSGLWVSDWYPEIATCADDLAVIRSCWADGLNHVGSVCQMNTGSILGGRPCLGSLVAVRPGQRKRNLPGFVVLLDDPDDPPGGSRNWGTGFMPASYQGTRFRDGKTPDPAPASRPAERGDVRQRAKLDFIQELNRRHLPTRADDADLEARIAAYELAYRMQSAAPEAVDLAQRDGRDARRCTAWTTRTTERIGRNCLLARRLVERGVRFVQLYCGSGSKWDAHSERRRQPRRATAARRDKPDRRSAEGPEAARPAGQHAGRSGAASSAARR